MLLLREGKAMNSRTVSLLIPAKKHQVFSYLSNIDNLPKWATEFCQELKKVDGKHKVVTCGPSRDEFFFRIQADEKTGVIDMFAGPTEDQMGVFPTRVIDLPGGSSAYVFTMFQAPGMSDDEFNSQYENLKKEMNNIKREFSSR